eukprot:768820-Hanusia_phi.AAC.3
MARSGSLSASGTVVYEMCMGGFDRSTYSAGEDLDGSKREAASTTFSTLRMQLRSSRQEASECRYRLQQAENAVNNVTMLLNAKTQSCKELEKRCEILQKQCDQLAKKERALERAMAEIKSREDKLRMEAEQLRRQHDDFDELIARGRRRELEALDRLVKAEKKEQESAVELREALSQIERLAYEAADLRSTLMVHFFNKCLLVLTSLCFTVCPDRPCRKWRSLSSSHVFISENNELLERKLVRESSRSKHREQILDHSSELTIFKPSMDRLEMLQAEVQSMEAEVPDSLEVRPQQDKTAFRNECRWFLREIKQLEKSFDELFFDFWNHVEPRSYESTLLDLPGRPSLSRVPQFDDSYQLRHESLSY